MLKAFLKRSTLTLTLLSACAPTLSHADPDKATISDIPAEVMIHHILPHLSEEQLCEMTGLNRDFRRMSFHTLSQKLPPVADTISTFDTGESLTDMGTVKRTVALGLEVTGFFEIREENRDIHALLRRALLRRAAGLGRTTAARLVADFDALEAMHAAREAMQAEGE